MVRNYLKYYSRLMVVLFIVGLMVGCSSETEHSTIIKKVLDVMKADAAGLGEPKVVADSLYFGTTRLNGNYELVDSLRAKYDCTATFFAKKGNAFIRISTNVMQEGHRAVGTQLDPDGSVIIAIQQGKPFYGTVDILGSQYETGYEPIMNADGEIIGVYYVGYQIKQ
ncbi:Cache 3/Cache 2 fusion domain-containing protein [candidate division KSB1 bacterium]|nr:Cache 3/Cache 2 fusion domain-containing protein [candidate division KSB1 bacterium]